MSILYQQGSDNLGFVITYLYHIYTSNFLWRSNSPPWHTPLSYCHVSVALTALMFGRVKSIGSKRRQYVTKNLMCIGQKGFSGFQTTGNRYWARHMNPQEASQNATGTESGESLVQGFTDPAEKLQGWNNLPALPKEKKRFSIPQVFCIFPSDGSSYHFYEPNKFQYTSNFWLRTSKSIPDS